MNGNYYSLISEGAIPSFEKPNTFQEIKFKNDSSYQSYLFKFPSARDDTRIQISEIEILANDVTKGKGGPEPSGDLSSRETFDKIDDYDMVAIDGSGGKHGTKGAVIGTM